MRFAILRGRVSSAWSRFAPEKVAGLPPCTVLKSHWSSGPAISEGNKETTLELVGPAYVHGFMDDQGMNWAEKGRL